MTCPKAAIVFQHDTITRTSEFRRIAALPRRTYSEAEAAALARKWTALLKTPNGTMELRPIQGVALENIYLTGGLVGPMRVGSGKTLVTLLAAAILKAERPLLMLPASLIEKTLRDRKDLMVHWKIPLNIQLYSYQMLSREGSANFLENRRQPDLIILDECHLAKNLKAGVTRRLKRYFEAHPETKAVVVSGTLLKEDLRDFAHLVKWALKDGSPVPIDRHELAAWAECLSKSSNPMQHVHPGALLSFAEKEDQCEDETETARKGFRRRFLATPGVVSSGGDQVSCSLYIEPVEYEVNSITEENFEKLRTLWETPDGWTLTQAVDVWRHARELALGFHYVWEPRPPDAWLAARKVWASYVREILSKSRSLDTELQVAHAHADSEEWRRWDDIRGTFQINSKPIWHDDSALVFCEEWMSAGPGIVWVDHAFFGRELSRRTCAPYFGEGGLDAKDNYIMDASPDIPIIASARANSTGRNLQAWNRNLITAPTSDQAMEQLLGRTHRDGQLADTVTADVVMTCREHYDSLVRAIEGARVNEQVMGHSQKLLLADVTVPEETVIKERGRTSYRWRGN